MSFGSIDCSAAATVALEDCRSIDHRLIAVGTVAGPQWGSSIGCLSERYRGADKHLIRARL
ncbi:hypothetical protein NJ7G_4152 [Natrinema sp. J7-2]|nr:hypothetical protein NJ7G_4152 [Natrinema sp. J7-2]